MSAMLVCLCPLWEEDLLSVSGLNLLLRKVLKKVTTDRWREGGVALAGSRLRSLCGNKGQAQWLLRVMS